MTKAEDERKRRLALALRENLKRRKAQDRARKAGEGAAVEGPSQADLPGEPPATERT